jgi:hypothetical protein
VLNMTRNICGECGSVAPSELELFFVSIQMFRAKRPPQLAIF